MSDRSGGSEGMPRWVKVSLIVAAIVLAAVVALMLVGGDGGHGPGRHMGVTRPVMQHIG